MDADVRLGAFYKDITHGKPAQYATEVDVRLRRTMPKFMQTVKLE